MRRMPTTAEMDRAFRRRDASYNGVFFAAVKTTGVFCVPSCPARKPVARNVEFFGTLQETLLAGYRPCKRCRPMDGDGRTPDWVARLIARVEASPTVRLRDADLRAMSIDPSRARRYFQQHYGMTFQAYHRVVRKGGALGGYGGGLWRKQHLLDHEHDVRERVATKPSGDRHVGANSRTRRAV